MNKQIKHPMEDADSWQNFQDVQARYHQQHQHRKLRVHHLQQQEQHHDHNHNHQKKKKKRTSSLSYYALEQEKERDYEHMQALQQSNTAHERAQALQQRQQTLQELWAHPGVHAETTHGLMIDAGSTGSRMHVFEWAPRVLSSPDDIKDALRGNKLSFPDSNSRWTDRLQPGLGSFANLVDDHALKNAVAEYLQPLLDFARTVLHAKADWFGSYPIFLRATAGMRILEPPDRARVMDVVRDLLMNNQTYCPFAFASSEQARVLSGEEEAIYDWAAVNFLLGDLIEQSEGIGTVVNATRTHGALDLGGASTQISFYEPREDVMANLFKLQIGQAKHWNVYAHSFLFYGINEAINRFQARLAADKTRMERLVTGIHNPCLPGGASVEIRTSIHLVSEDGGGVVVGSGDHGSDNGGVSEGRRDETWNYTEIYPSGNGFYQALLTNTDATGDFDACMTLTKPLLQLEKNSWCQFAHRGDCSFAGIYQPRLPSASSLVSEDEEFVAFSNYYHIWKFLNLPERATLTQLMDATRDVCSMSRDQLVEFDRNRSHVKKNKSSSVMNDDEDELNSYCFRSVYAFQLLHNGYGFSLNATIRATKVINGHKVGWALGAMLYEINTLPWTYEENTPTADTDALFSPNTNPSSSIFRHHHQQHLHHSVSTEMEALFLGAVGLGLFCGLLFVLRLGQRRLRIQREYEYEPIK